MFGWPRRNKFTDKDWGEINRAQIASISHLVAGKIVADGGGLQHPGPDKETPMKAVDICRRAADLVGGDRDRQHGSKVHNHANIADLWSAYLGNRLATRLEARDVALMMVLLKVARTKTGSHNDDDYVDMAGYAGCAGEIAKAELLE